MGAVAVMWELTFDGIPPGPNERMHWREKAKLTRQWRYIGFLKVQEARIPLQEQGVRLSATFRRRRLGVADEDNDRARLKPVQDSLMDAHVIYRDTRKFVQWGPVTEEHGEPGFVLRIEAVSAARSPAGEGRA